METPKLLSFYERALMQKEISFTDRAKYAALWGLATSGGTYMHHPNSIVDRATLAEQIRKGIIDMFEGISKSIGEPDYTNIVDGIIGHLYPEELKSAIGEWSNYLQALGRAHAGAAPSTAPDIK